MGMSNKVHTIMQIFFKSRFFVQRPKTKTKIKVSVEKYISPQKICGHVEFLKTPSKNSPKIPKKISIKVRIKDNKIGYVKTTVFARNLSGRVICTFNSPAKLCRQTSKKIAGHTPKSIIWKSIFLNKSVVRYKTPLGR